MKLHEYQAKSLLQQAGLPVPAGLPILAVGEISTVIKKLPAGPWVVKAQVHTGGRGKAGGIVMAQNPLEVEAAAKKLFGKTLVTHQTGPEGIVIRKLYVEQAQVVARELYLACILDRSKGYPVIMASTQGGMEIEELARTKPDAILYEAVDPWTGLQPYRARSLAQRLGLRGAALASFATVAQGLAKAFLTYDASLLEINPLGLINSGVRHDSLTVDPK